MGLAVRQYYGQLRLRVGTRASRRPAAVGWTLCILPAVRRRCAAPPVCTSCRFICSATWQHAPAWPRSISHSASTVRRRMPERPDDMLTGVAKSPTCRRSATPRGDLGARFATLCNDRPITFAHRASPGEDGYPFGQRTLARFHERFLPRVFVGQACEKRPGSRGCGAPASVDRRRLDRHRCLVD